MERRLKAELEKVGQRQGAARRERVSIVLWVVAAAAVGLVLATQTGLSTLHAALEVGR